VTPTEVLADLVRDKLGGKLPVYVVTDGIETESLVKAADELIEYARVQECRRPLIEKIRNSQQIHQLLELWRTATLRGVIYHLAKFAFRKFVSVLARITRWPLHVIPRIVSSSSKDL